MAQEEKKRGDNNNSNKKHTPRRPRSTGNGNGAIQQRPPMTTTRFGGFMRRPPTPDSSSSENELENMKKEIYGLYTAFDTGDKNNLRIRLCNLIAHKMNNEDIKFSNLIKILEILEGVEEFVELLKTGKDIIMDKDKEKDKK